MDAAENKGRQILDNLSHRRILLINEKRPVFRMAMKKKRSDYGQQGRIQGAESEQLLLLAFLEPFTEQLPHRHDMLADFLDAIRIHYDFLLNNIDKLTIAVAKFSYLGDKKFYPFNGA